MTRSLKSMVENETPKKSQKSFLVSLITILLISSLFVGMFVPNVEGQTAIHVGTEAELRAAVSNASNGVPVDITLDKEIGLTGGALIIPANKDITLRSNGNNEFELFGASGANTITVENQGTLTLAGITVTHVSGASGSGVGVDSGGKLTMTGGKIAGNTVSNGGGVSVFGFFVMEGGEISGNRASNCGGGVYNYGTFNMKGGEISRNIASGGEGGGVYNARNFVMSGGAISSNNAAFSQGGGVYNHNQGTFTMDDGEISGNTAYAYQGGGGACNYGTFTMNGGKISGNTASRGSGGGVYHYGTFTLLGGEISSNNAVSGGGGVLVDLGSFVVEGGKISGNTVSGGGGGGVYISSSGSASLRNCEISGNTASSNGGGCWVTNGITNFNRLIIRDGVVFSDNRALLAYNRAPEHDSIYRAYIADSAKWTEPFTQGYNNFDISYVFGTSITAFTVTVNDGYGTPTGAGSYSAGQTVTLNAGTRAGYNFAGWTVNEGGATLSSTTGTTATFTMPTGNVVITSRWTIIQYTIRYTLNSGSNAAGNPTAYNVESSFPITIGNPARANYEFRGWNVTYADGTQTTFQTSYSIPAGTTGNIDLAANWATPATSDAGGSGSGSGSGSSNSGGSSSSNGGGGSGNAGNSGDSNNIAPYNDNNNPSGSNDNEQHTADNEPSIISTARFAGVLGVTLCLFLVIVAAYRKIDRSRVEKINENKELELPGRAQYPVCWSAVSIAKLNIISERALGKNTKFSRVDVSTYFLLFLLPVIFLFVGGVLLNPAFYTAIFSLDFAAFGTAFVEGFSTFDVDMLFLVGIGAVAGFLLYALIMVRRLFNGIMDTREGMRDIIWHYLEYERTLFEDEIVRRLYNLFSIYSRHEMYTFAGAFSSGDKIDKEALTLLIECHNEAVRQSGGYQRFS